MGRHRGGRCWAQPAQRVGIGSAGPTRPTRVLADSKATIATFAFFLLEPRATADRQGIRVGLVVFAPFVGPQVLELAWRRERVALRIAVVVLAVLVALVGGICGARDGEHERGR